jgi:hypothetical protein
MIPSVNDRLASVVRALTDVVMPSLPPEAGLAKEQIQLAVGHLQILQVQLDGSLAFEARETEDARALGQMLHAKVEGGPHTQTALVALASALNTTTDMRSDRIAIHAAIDLLIKASSIDGSSAFRTELGKIIIAHQTDRTIKDRKWFEPMGFDAGI